MEEKEEVIIEENYIQKYPIQASIDKIETILKQMKNCICKIYKEKKSGNKIEVITETGFFLKIPYPNERNYIKLLVTNNHTLNSDYLENKKKITFSLFNESIMSNIIISEERKVYTNEKSDITLIEIQNNDDKDSTIDYLELDNNINKEEEYYDILYREKPIYVLHYPEGKEIIVSYGVLNRIVKEEINHFCSTENGSSGAPIISLNNLKVIGVHCGGHPKFKYNIGFVLKKAIFEFLSLFSKKINNNDQNIYKRNKFSRLGHEITNNNNQKSTSSNIVQKKKITKKFLEYKELKRGINKFKRNENGQKKDNALIFNSSTTRNSFHSKKKLMIKILIIKKFTKKVKA
jgi:V8-like Glu-specific endopeptidase